VRSCDITPPPGRTSYCCTIDSLLSLNRGRPAVDELAEQILEALTSDPQQRKTIAETIGCSDDGTVDRALKSLERACVAEKAGRGLWVRATAGTIEGFSRHLRVLAADAPRLHGLTPSLAVIEELHAHRDDEVYLALKTAALKTPGARLVVISTAGQGADTPHGRLHARALAQPDVHTDGAFTDARGTGLRMLEWAVPADADVDNPAVVKQANPASWITADALAGQRQAVPDPRVPALPLQPVGLR
jgi:hypothetical protein